MGDLTIRLLEDYHLKAYEVDEGLRSFLIKKFDGSIKHGILELLWQDVLELPQSKGWLDEENYILVSNLPYYIASAILMRALKDPRCKGFVVMTQKEVAQKFCALSGKKEFCALSVITQTFGGAQMLFDVPPQVFDPAPKVTSSVFRMRKNEAILPKGFEEMLKIAFNAPRKKLLNNLATRYGDLNAVFKKLSIKENARAHEILTATYHQIFNILKAENYGKQRQPNSYNSPKLDEFE